MHRDDPGGYTGVEEHLTPRKPSRGGEAKGKRVSLSEVEGREVWER